MPVAPRVGAWIETTAPLLRCFFYASHPVWVRGLKQKICLRLPSLVLVAPRVGAWIET